jgi:hypothetical protein
MDYRGPKRCDSCSYICLYHPARLLHAWPAAVRLVSQVRQQPVRKQFEHGRDVPRELALGESEPAR